MTRESLARGRRRGQRGAALVEMVVVVPVFIVLFAGMVFLHHTAAKTQRSMLAARRQAWDTAMNGCMANGGVVPQPNLTSDMNGAPGSDSSILANLGSSTGTASDVADVSVFATGPATVAGAGSIGFHSDIHSTVIVSCNAQTRPGDLPGVLQWFWGSSGGQTVWDVIFGNAH